MQKAFLKVAFVSLLSISSVFAAEGNLLSQATSGVVSAEKSAVLALNDAEMKDIVGGAYSYQKNCFYKYV